MLVTIQKHFSASIIYRETGRKMTKNPECFMFKDYCILDEKPLISNKQTSFASQVVMKIVILGLINKPKEMKQEIFIIFSYSFNIIYTL